MSGERSFWRDPDLKPWHEEHGFPYPIVDDLSPISERHRMWGPLYACDIDFPFVEQDLGLLISITDYKARNGLKEIGNETDKQRNYNNRALSDLSTSKGQLPFFITLYIKFPWAFRVHPMNDKASEYAQKGQIFTELDYVAWLHNLREKQVSAPVVSRCDNQILWESLHPSLNQPRKHKSKKKRDKSSYTLFDQNPILQQMLEVAPTGDKSA